MEWTPDVSVGDWLRERTDDPWQGTMHDVVPRGFAAYAHVFHPTTRSRPVGMAWPPLPQDAHRRAWDAFADARPEIDTEAARWRDAAASFGTELHPTAQWGALVGRAPVDGPVYGARSRSDDGWEYDAPREGELDAATLAAIGRHLAARGTAVGYAAVWEGWGGLVGHLGVAPTRALLSSSSDEPDLERHQEMLAHAMQDPFNRPYAKESWQPGILDDAVSRGPRLSLPGRDYVLFWGPLDVFADPTWPHEVPWRDAEMERAGFAQFAASPSLMWPSDRSWVLATEVDFDSTIVGGDAALIEAVCADPALEALPLPAGSSLQWDADAVNR